MKASAMILAMCACVLGGAVVALAEEPPAPGGSALQRWARQETLTDNWFGLGKTLDEYGVTTTLDFMQVYQVPLGGAAPVRFHAGRYTGKYKWRTHIDLEKLIDWPGASIQMRVEGGWSDGLYAPQAESAMDTVNVTAPGDHPIALSKFRFEQKLFDDRLIVRLGKLDTTATFDFHGSAVAFDGNAYANDEDTQFLSYPFVNNPIVAFPSKGIGAIVLVEPVERFYIAAGLADADANQRETGFNTACHDEFNEFYVAESGYVAQIPSANGPLQGAYRFGLWYQPMVNGPEAFGFYSSCDQKLYRESPDDEQGLGVFFRFGYADGDLSPVRTFWSIGGVYEGLIPGRDTDVLGLAWAQGIIGHNANYRADIQNNMELYYRFRLTEFMSVTPNVQYIMEPGGGQIGQDVAILGCRVRISF
jgi:porin